MFPTRFPSVWFATLAVASLAPAGCINLRASDPTATAASTTVESEIKAPNQCPQKLTWALPAKDAVTAIFSELQPLAGKGHAEFQAMNTNFGTLGLLRDDHGRFYASLRIPGIAAELKLSASGAGVDVTRTEKQPGSPNTLKFHGIHAVLELGADDIRLEDGHLQSPLPFMLRLTPDPEAAHQFWAGWPRSFAYRLQGYVGSPERNVWRLLADVQGRVVVGGKGRSESGFFQSLSSAFLPMAASGQAPIQSGKQCTTSGKIPASGVAQSSGHTVVEAGAVRFGAVWYQLDGKGAWMQLRKHSSEASSGNSTLVVSELPDALSKYPVPDGDNSPAGDHALGLRRLGTTGAQRLSSWGQYYNVEKVFSCVTPDLAAVMADPMQYVPPPKVAPDFEAQGFCTPMLAEHFWWAPPGPATGPDVPKIEWYYNEITVEKSAPFSFFMANGFQGGYFGIQEHGDGRRFAIFSLWDAGSMVEIVDWGKDVRVGRFGAEGTGANSHMEFPWVEDEAVQFLVNAKLEETASPTTPAATVYSGYIRDPKVGVWRLMSKLRVRPCGLSAKAGGYLTGLNSFLEVFQPLPKRPHCDKYGVERRARYGTPWYKAVGMSSFEPLEKVSLTATCPASGCPKSGLNFEKQSSGDSDAFVLHVGETVKNAGMPIGEVQTIRKSAPAPTVLLRSPLPDLDMSPAGDWSPGQRRPIRGFGSKDRLQRWGKRSGGDINCPWYVSVCGKDDVFR